MSTSEAVYQPTTVTYEANSNPQQQQQRWSDHPISYLTSTVSQAAHRPCGISCSTLRTMLPIIYLTSAIACFAIGLTMLLHGAIGYSNMEQQDGFYLSVSIIGALLLILAFLFVSLYLKLTRRFCFRPGKDHLEGSGAQNLTVNPSTDLLVTAQYAPVSEVAYQPPPEETEQSKLMPVENNKEIISNEDSDRMVENDPRIVLRPLNQQNLTEET